ncbi:MAG: polymer-forming cytoskeletal protein [Anaerolineae bacterium]|nr:MAG: polymer-forming cytoskeletal protein [Anaerolineae bacterium]
MKIAGKWLIVLSLLVALFLPTNVAYAQGPSDGQVIFGGTFTLQSGDTLEGDLVIIGGAATIEEGALVTGSIAVVGGTLTVDGEIGEDVVVVGGLAALNETAVVHGQLVTVGGSVERAEGALVEGGVVSNVPGPTVNLPGLPGGVPQRFPLRAIGMAQVVSPWLKIFNDLLTTVGMAALAMLVMLFLQPQVERVAETIVSQPLTAGGIGLLTGLVLPILIVLMAVTIILLPVALLIAFIVPLVGVFGLIALGHEIGKRFTAMLQREWHPALSTGLGTLFLFLAFTVIGLIPCAGTLANILIILTAFGGVLVTLLASRRVTPPSPGEAS